MTDNLIKQENTVRSLRRLMLGRLVIVTFLLGIAAFIQIKGTQPLLFGSIPHVSSIIIVTYILSLLYVFIFKRSKSLQINAYIQALCDVVLITMLVYVTGGIESVYSVLYQFVIIYSVLFLARRGGLIAASASSLLYGLLLALEFYGVLTAYGATAVYSFNAGYVLSRVFIHIVSFYIVAILVSFVVEQEKRSRSLLTEKESEFDQLDLLHRSIIEHVNAGIVTIDLKGNIKSFNRAAGEISGYSFSDVEGKPIDYFFPAFLGMLKKMKNEKTESGQTKRGEIVISNRQGRDIVLGFSFSSLMGSRDDRIGDIVIFQDLTSTKEMEKEVEKSKQLALIGEMAAGLAHEIRNPLTALSGSIQLLKRNLDLEETDARLMQIVLRGREQLENLISNFLLLAKPRLTDREQIDINGIVDDVIESVHYSPDWNENIKVEKEPRNRFHIYGNRTEVKQMIWNLVLNAVQSMSDGGTVKISTSVTAADKGKDYLGISISDTGCGIEKEGESKVFTPFYTTKESGTGLGLAIASRIVESHGGEIKIESNVGVGTICNVFLPRDKRSKPRDAESH